MGPMGGVDGEAEYDALRAPREVRGTGGACGLSEDEVDVEGGGTGEEEEEVGVDVGPLERLNSVGRGRGWLEGDAGFAKAVAVAVVLAVFLGAAGYQLGRPGIPGGEGGTGPVGPAVTVLAVGDWGRAHLCARAPGDAAACAGADAQRRTAEAMGSVVGRTRGGVSAVIGLGDSFYENGLAGDGDDAFDVSFSGVYGNETAVGGLASVPWANVLGNHDYHGDPLAQVRVSGVPGRGARWFCERDWVKGWVADGGGESVAGGGDAMLEVVALDTSPFVGEYLASGGGQFYNWTGLVGGTVNASAPGGVTFEAVRDMPAVQVDMLQRLEARLAASNARWTVVAGHHPVRSVGDHGSTAELVAKLEPVLAKHGVRVYLSGHEHDMEHILWPAAATMGGGTVDVHYVVSGAGSSTRTPSGMHAGLRFAHGGSGFVALEASWNTLKVDFYSADGAQILHSFAAQR